MFGNFSYCNLIKLYFGENSLSNLSDELKKYGDNVVLVYGSRDEKIKVLSDSL
jgi:alcohol dehydrogenase YqhD (iron-dependent ADH family)